MIITLIIYIFLFTYYTIKFLFNFKYCFLNNNKFSLNYPLFNLQLDMLNIYKNQSLIFILSFIFNFLFFNINNCITFCMDNPLSDNYSFNRCSTEIKKHHLQASTLNRSLHENVLYTTYNVKRNLQENEFGKIPYLDSYVENKINRYITSIDQNGDFFTKDLRDIKNLCIGDDTKILTPRPYYKYANFLNQNFLNFFEYDLVYKQPYLNFKNISFFLTITPSILNNLTLNYISSYPYGDKFNSPKLITNEMKMLFENSLELFKQTNIYLEQNIKYNVELRQYADDISSLSKIFDLSNANLDSLSKIFKDPLFKEYFYFKPRLLENLYPVYTPLDFANELEIFPRDSLGSSIFEGPDDRDNIDMDDLSNEDLNEEKESVP